MGMKKMISEMIAPRSDGAHMVRRKRRLNSNISMRCGANAALIGNSICGAAQAPPNKISHAAGLRPDLVTEHVIRQGSALTS